MKYRRNFAPGGSYFFTVVTENRRPILASKNSIEVLRNAFRAVRVKYPFEIDAIVVLPDHLHCIWTLQTGDGDFATRWRLIKTWFTKRCDQSLRSTSNHARITKREQAVWQRRYWEHTLCDDEDFARHVDYIHYNPVKHGLVAKVVDWPYSSFHKYVRSGIYQPDWGANDINYPGVGHE